MGGLGKLICHCAGGLVDDCGVLLVDGELESGGVGKLIFGVAGLMDVGVLLLVGEVFGAE